MSKKKRPPVTGRRSNYAHLTEVNLQAFHHRFVKRVHRVFTARSVYYSCVPHPARNIQTSAGRNGLQINSQLIRVSKHSIVSHRSPASESGIFLLSGKSDSKVAAKLASSGGLGRFPWGIPRLSQPDLKLENGQKKTPPRYWEAVQLCSMVCSLVGAGKNSVEGRST